MFRKILIANRGEVANRIKQTCQKMNIETVIVATDIDKKLRFLDEFSESISLGDKREYLNKEKIIQITKEQNCSAIHPGWGFLSENPTFAAMAEAVGITFVGPNPTSMRKMADKAMARSTMRALGLSPIPGVDDFLLTVEDAKEAALQVGYPLLLKAVAGGGGKGMRKVFDPNDLEDAFLAASAEAQNAFGNAAMYMERLIVGGRHIEFQVLCDGKRAVVLGERECSIQRRHQKLLEETPSPVVDVQQCMELSKIIADVCVALQYRGAGTMEMLRDQSGEIFFMERNTRLQVEHTITEERFDIDLVAEQLKIAANHPLDIKVLYDSELVEENEHRMFRPKGHSIQCRINAEDVFKNFQPTPGTISNLKWPKMDGIRIDTHLREGDTISPHYDSMIAKIITSAPTRNEAINLMIQALELSEIEGVPTTIPLHLSILKHPKFISGEYTTSFIEEFLEELLS